MAPARNTKRSVADAEADDATPRKRAAVKKAVQIKEENAEPVGTPVQGEAGTASAKKPTRGSVRTPAKSKDVLSVLKSPEFSGTPTGTPGEPSPLQTRSARKKKAAVLGKSPSPLKAMTPAKSIRTPRKATPASKIKQEKLDSDDDSECDDDVDDVDSDDVDDEDFQVGKRGKTPSKAAAKTPVKAAAKTPIKAAAKAPAKDAEIKTPARAAKAKTPAKEAKVARTPARGSSRVSARKTLNSVDDAEPAVKEEASTEQSATSVETKEPKVVSASGAETAEDVPAAEDGKASEPSVVTESEVPAAEAAATNVVVAASEAPAAKVESTSGVVETVPVPANEDVVVKTEDVTAMETPAVNAKAAPASETPVAEATPAPEAVAIPDTSEPHVENIVEAQSESSESKKKKKKFPTRTEAKIKKRAKKLKKETKLADEMEAIPGETEGQKTVRLKKTTRRRINKAVKKAAAAAAAAAAATTTTTTGTEKSVEEQANPTENGSAEEKAPVSEKKMAQIEKAKLLKKERKQKRLETKAKLAEEKKKNSSEGTAVEAPVAVEGVARETLSAAELKKKARKEKLAARKERIRARKQQLVATKKPSGEFKLPNFLKTETNVKRLEKIRQDLIEKGKLPKEVEKDFGLICRSIVKRLMKKPCQICNKMGHLKEDCIKAPVDGTEKKPKVWGFGAMVQKNAERIERRREMLDPNEKGPESYAKLRKFTALRLTKTKCMGCLQTGHVLARCPQRKVKSAKKCYKCGKPDHTSKNCSIKEEVYTHAECFLCHEIGHLTRNCPTNKKGIYPHGGGCHHCGANDHFARLCPKKEQEKQDENKEPEKTEKVAVGLLDNKQSGDADVVPVETKDCIMKPMAKKQVVKF